MYKLGDNYTISSFLISFLQTALGIWQRYCKATWQGCNENKASEASTSREKFKGVPKIQQSREIII